MAVARILSQTTPDTYEFPLAAGATAQVFCDPPLGHRETVQLNRSTGTGSTWTVEVMDEKGLPLLSEGKNNAIITGPGYFQIAKSPTDASTAVYLDE